MRLLWEEKAWENIVKEKMRLLLHLVKDIIMAKEQARMTPVRVLQKSSDWDFFVTNRFPQP